MNAARRRVALNAGGLIVAAAAVLVTYQYLSAQPGGEPMPRGMAWDEAEELTGEGSEPRYRRPYGADEGYAEEASGDYLESTSAPVPREEARRRAQAPNLTLEVHQRTFVTGRKGYVRVSLYNLRAATLSAYRIDLQELVPNAKAVAIDDPKDERGLPYRLKHLNLSGRPRARSWTVALKTTYRGSWRSQDTAILGLPEGVYVIVGKGGGVEQRTWLAISSRALVVKRSPDKLFGWLVDARTGQPIKDVTVAIYNESGTSRAIVKTERDGRFRYPTSSATEDYWVATRTGSPAFVRATPPSRVPSHRAYVYTDRPIYRPGHNIRFRGTLRQVERTQYSLPTDLTTANVKIRSTGGDTIYDEDLALNDWGTFSGDFQLAPEPPLGRYELVTTVGEGAEEAHFYTTFEVEAYRKPEFEVGIEIPQKHYLAGSTIPVTISADYYFGGPVAGGKVSYRVNFVQRGDYLPPQVLTAAGLGSAAPLSIEDSFTGEGRLDGDGKLTFEVSTTHAPVDRYMRVDATVSEFALRPREARASTMITAALYRLTIQPESDGYVVGDTAVVIVRTEDYEGKPVSDEVEITLIESKRDREGRYYEDKTTRKVQTDEEGRARVSYKLERPGGYRVEAWGTDEEGNAVFAQTRFWVGEEREKRRWPALRLSPDKKEYTAGEVAIVHGETNMLGSWMLVTVEGEFLYDAVVHRLLGNEFNLRIPIKENHKPSVHVNAIIVRDGQRTGAHAQLLVPANERRLEVTVSPDQDRYEPGQPARYTITTRDYEGQGVPAEVGVGVVDQALYAIREDETPPPFDVFWSPRDARVTTEFSLAELYPGGAYQVVARLTAPLPAGPGVLPPPEAAEEGIRIRRRFLDTAYWGPSVITGPDGSAEISFEMPDNLTTWRATARALTETASGGEGRQETTVTLPLLVRLIVPRFYVAGDEGTVAAVVHNYTEETREVKVALTAEGARVIDGTEQTISLAPDGSQRLTWRIEALGPDSARFLVSADGGEGAADAMEQTLPVAPSGIKNVEAFAGVSDESVTQAITLPANAIADSARLEITISPSLAGPIFEALEYLERYPYGCAEQTLDSFLPNVVVARTLKKLEVDRPKPAMLDRYVSFGLQKLLRYQHEDGGWHWWEFDDSDPYMTAYVVYGLKIADEAGYVGAFQAMRRGTEYLHGALQEEEYRGARAYLLWALAHADQWTDKTLAAARAVALELFEEREKLDVFSRASLALALSRLSQNEAAGDPAELKAAAETLAGELDGLAVRTGIGSHWTAGARYQYSWLDNDVEVTAQVLRALLDLKPESENVVPAVRWLMATRRGKAWSSTKDTAAAVLALSNYLEHAEELQPDYSATIALGDTQIGEAKMGADSVFADPVRIEADASKIQTGENQLRIEKQGQGTVYWSARLHYLLPAEEALPVAKGIAVERTYRVPVENPIAAGEQKPGCLVQTELRIVAEENMRYALLEEPIPAGCEVVAGDEEPWRERWDRREVWDNRIVFFFDYLPKGEHFVEYILRTEAPGQYKILPSMAALMYFPEVSGHNRLVRMRIRELREDEQ